MGRTRKTDEPRVDIGLAIGRTEDGYEVSLFWRDAQLGRVVFRTDRHGKHGALGAIMTLVPTLQRFVTIGELPKTKAQPRGEAEQEAAGAQGA